MKDRQAFSRVLRGIGKQIGRGELAAALSEIDARLTDGNASPANRGRLLALAGDSEYRRGAYELSARVYDSAFRLVREHPCFWLRPIIGCVRALLKQSDVAAAHGVATEALEIAVRKHAQFEADTEAARVALQQGGTVAAPGRVHRVSVVASRLGRLFEDEGELGVAGNFYDAALRESPGGACRARQGLARIKLATGDAHEAARLAAESIRVGGYAAKTIPSWPILIAARRKAGGWMIGERLLEGLQEAPPQVRARAILAIVRSLRSHDMRQWRNVLHQWSATEGAASPAVEVELRKLVLASTKVTAGNTELKRRAAERLLDAVGLSPIEWIAGAKEFLRASLVEGRSIDPESLVSRCAARYDARAAIRARHSLALSCVLAKRHDLARSLLERNLGDADDSSTQWGRSCWALARIATFQRDHVAAAELYRRYAEREESPQRLRLQARMLWAQELLKSGNAEALVLARESLEPVLASISDPVLLMDFARQIPERNADFKAWREAIFDRGAALARASFENATTPSVAAAVLAKLARRQVYDFDRAADAIRMWDGLSDAKRAWLWSKERSFWDYAGWILRAYIDASRADDAHRFARAWLDDPATPPEGRAIVGTPYARFLIRRGDARAGLALMEQIVTATPTEYDVAEAWYWLALAAHKRGDVAERNRCCESLRRAQGLSIGLLSEWALDAKALLLMASLDRSALGPEAVNYTGEFLGAMEREIAQHLGAFS